MTVPYIGVAGITKRAQVDALLANLPARTSRKIQIGVQVSSLTLHGKPSSQPMRAVPVRMIPDVFLEDDPRTMNVVHFYSHTPDDTIRFRRDLRLVMDVAGTHCHGIQLNNHWIPPSIVEEFYEEFPEVSIILAVNKEACRELKFDPSAVADRFADWYGGIADFAFFDWSRGFGREIAPGRILPYLDALASRGTGVELAMAGGLDASNVGLLEPLLKRFPNLSWDAQGRLRDEEDRLRTSSAEEFVLSSLSLIENIQVSS